MHQTTTEQISIQEKRKGQKVKLFFNKITPNSLLEGTKSISKLALVQEFLPETGEVGTRIKKALTLGGQAVTQIDNNITLFSTNATLIPQLLVDNGVFPADFIDADLIARIKELASQTVNVPVIFDKCTNILSFLYY